MRERSKLNYLLQNQISLVRIKQNTNFQQSSYIQAFPTQAQIMKFIKRSLPPI